MFFSQSDSHPDHNSKLYKFVLEPLNFADDIVRNSNSRNRDIFKIEQTGGGGRQGFMNQGFWTKLGMDYGFLTSSPLDCGFEMVSG